MNRELARKRPANEVSSGPVIIGHLVATARPVPRRTVLQRITTPADWPAHVVLLLHLALAGLVVLPLIWLAEYLGRQG
jgi:hypothetical protein